METTTPPPDAPDTTTRRKPGRKPKAPGKPRKAPKPAEYWVMEETDHGWTARAGTPTGNSADAIAWVKAQAATDPPTRYIVVRVLADLTARQKMVTVFE